MQSPALANALTQVSTAVTSNHTEQPVKRSMGQIGAMILGFCVIAVAGLYVSSMSSPGDAVSDGSTVVAMPESEVSGPEIATLGPLGPDVSAVTDGASELLAAPTEAPISGDGSQGGSKPAGAPESGPDVVNSHTDATPETEPVKAVVSEVRGGEKSPKRTRSRNKGTGVEKAGESGVSIATPTAPRPSVRGVKVTGGGLTVSQARATIRRLSSKLKGCFRKKMSGTSVKVNMMVKRDGSVSTVKANSTDKARATAFQQCIEAAGIKSASFPSFDAGDFSVIRFEVGQP